MMVPLLILAAGLVALVLLAVLLHRRQREEEERAARTLARLRHRHATLADRRAEIGLEVGALYDEVPPPSHPRPTD
jgi:hypothetical protein